MLALSRGFGVWRKLLTLAVSQAERHQHALSKTLSLSLALPLFLPLSLSCSAFLSLSLALKCIKPCKAIAPLPKKRVCDRKCILQTKWRASAPVESHVGCWTRRLCQSPLLDDHGCNMDIIGGKTTWHCAYCCSSRGSPTFGAHIYTIVSTLRS